MKDDATDNEIWRAAIKLTRGVVVGDDISGCSPLKHDGRVSSINDVVFD